MTELTPLFMDINSVYSGDELGLPYRDLLGEGTVAATDLAVTQRAAGANLSVDVAAGACWIAGDTNVTRQPTYRCLNDATVNKGITPDPSNPRKVLIVAQITDEGFAGTGRLWQIVAIHGTPAASPAEPALPASALPLALVDVATNATSITNANITDRRARASVGGGNIPAGGGGGELAYAQFTSIVSLTNAHTIAAPLDVVTAPAITCDGTSAIIVSFHCASALAAAGVNWQVGVSLWDSADQGLLAYFQNNAAANLQLYLSGWRRLIPSAGSHTYRIRGWIGGGATAGQIIGQAGGAGVAQPGAIRITRA